MKHPKWTLSQKMDLIQVDRLDEYQPLGRYLILLFRAFEDELIHELKQSGYEDVRASDLNILRFVSPRGSLPSEIAKLAGITKQAVGKMAGSLEKRGYLTLTQGDYDKRTRVVRFSPVGEQLVGEMVEIIIRIEKRFAAALGKSPYKKLKSQLEKLFSLYRK
ncbi:MAG: MarR family transcriptional regulator [Deltaproteobacteria bacterium]|nr:MarR family transcriptional regulator [Deltaproteobacteria bacterium]